MRREVKNIIFDSPKITKEDIRKLVKENLIKTQDRIRKQLRQEEVKDD